MIRQSRRRLVSRRVPTWATAGAWLILAASQAWAQSYTLDWWTVDGGGGQVIATPYALGFTTGQPDAGAAINGRYALTSGFWAIASSALQPTPLPTATFTVTPTLPPTATFTPTGTATATATVTATASPTTTPSASPTSVTVSTDSGESASRWQVIAILGIALGLLSLRHKKGPSQQTRFARED